jgi:ABC-type lipoprotein release transport system permease subunit
VSVLRLILREIAYRKLNFALALVAVVAAVTLFVGTLTLSLGMANEARIVTREMGFNLLILPENAEMTRFWSLDYAAAEMPEGYVDKLAGSRLMTVRHLVARLSKRVEWRGHNVILTGVRPETPVMHEKRMDKERAVDPGQAILGYEIGRATGVKPGDTIAIGDVEARELTVKKVVATPQGSKDDVRIYAHLDDVQAITGNQDVINEIEALGCRCEGDLDPKDRLRKIAGDIRAHLPGVQVREMKSIAQARVHMREMVERWTALIVPFVLVVCAVWIGLLALGNVDERRAEIGILRAQGVGSIRVAALFLGKAMVVGLAGALVGYLAGTALAREAGPAVFELTGSRIKAVPALLGWSLMGAPLLAMLASYLPAMLAVTQDPAVVLREE